MVEFGHREYRELYESAEPLRHVSNGEEGEIFFNGRQATDIAYRSALSCLEIPKAFFERSSLDLRNRILKEKIAERDGDLLVSKYGDLSVGVLPKEKRDTFVPPSLIAELGQEDEDVESLGSPLRDMYSTLWKKTETFELPGDSKYYIGPFVVLNMWGPNMSTVTLRLLRETCVNGATAMVEASHVNLQGHLLTSFLTNMIKTATDTGKKTARQLELMKERSYALDSLLSDKPFEPLPKISRKKVALVIERMKEGQEKIEDALVNTQFGALYAITAAAREYKSRLRASVESVGWNYLSAQMKMEESIQN